MFAIKAPIDDPSAKTFSFPAQKTMYRGKRIAKGNTVYLFASENETELNFKFCRQATNKIVGLSEAAAAFLGGFFE